MKPHFIFRLTRRWRGVAAAAALIVGGGLLLAPAPGAQGEPAPFPKFESHEVDAHCGVGRMVEVTDVNGDRKPDILALTDTTLCWYENPGWEKHLIIENLDGTNICMAAQDLDEDGLPEVAVGAAWDIAKTKTGGTLYILSRNRDPAQPWKSHKIAEEPTLHRVCWADMDGDGKKN